MTQNEVLHQSRVQSGLAGSCILSVQEDFFTGKSVPGNMNLAGMLLSSPGHQCYHCILVDGFVLASKDRRAGYWRPRWRWRRDAWLLAVMAAESVG